MMLSLTPEALSAIAEWQRVTGCAEVCALCALDDSGNQHLLRLANYSSLPGSFEISCAEEDGARRAIAERQWTAAAFVHTHPAHGPEMSVSDVASFQQDTLPWIIVGFGGGLVSQCTYVQQDAGNPGERPLRGTD